MGTKTSDWDHERLIRTVVQSDTASDYDHAYYRAFVSLADRVEVEVLNEVAMTRRIEAGRWH